MSVTNPSSPRRRTWRSGWRGGRCQRRQQKQSRGTGEEHVHPGEGRLLRMIYFRLMMSYRFLLNCVKGRGASSCEEWRSQQRIKCRDRWVILFFSFASLSLIFLSFCSLMLCISLSCLFSLILPEMHSIVMFRNHNLDVMLRNEKTNLKAGNEEKSLVFHC